MYGSRARIGYISPLMVTEVFIYEFYQVVPRGVTLAITTLTGTNLTPEESEESLKLTQRAARQMGRSGVSVILLGGVYLNVFLGFDKLQEHIRATEEEAGVPVTTSLNAQVNAFKALGSRKVGVVHLGEARQADDVSTRHLGVEIVGVNGIGSSPPELGRITSDASVHAARELVRQHPEADTIFFPGAHRPTMDRVESMEQEFGVNVVSASQAIYWETLRRCGINEPIAGFGRLMREPGVGA